MNRYSSLLAAWNRNSHFPTARFLVTLRAVCEHWVMKKILFVDDDALVARIYSKELAQAGFEVTVAEDGLAAMKMLSTIKPDLAVLDIMMPKFSGLEVLDYIRSQPGLKATRVVILSNYFTNDKNRQAATAKADGALTKFTCTPALLIKLAAEILSGDTAKTSDSLPGSTGKAPVSSARAVTSPPAKPPPSAPKASKAVPEKKVEVDIQARTRGDLLKNKSKTLATIRQLNEAFIKGDSPQVQGLRLLDFYRKIHNITAMAGLAGCEEIALLSSAFEALLFELYERPEQINPSTLQTIANTLDFFRLLFAHAERTQAGAPMSAKALVVDDDRVTNRAIVVALRLANLKAIGVHSPLDALKTLEEDRYDLILVDIMMSGMDGFELCEKLRVLPRYKRTPVIFVTSNAEFETRIHSVLSGGNDLIAKPVFPVELAVKAVTHLLRSQFPEEWALG
jgi:CheY-like chemotaxis protein